MTQRLVRLAATAALVVGSEASEPDVNDPEAASTPESRTGAAADDLRGSQDQGRVGVVERER